MNNQLFQGDKAYMKCRWPMRRTAGPINWKYRLDADADQVFEFDDPPGYFSGPQFTFLPKEPAYVQLTAPADIVVGEPFDLAVVVFDTFANEASSADPVTIDFTSDATFPESTDPLDMDCIASASCPPSVTIPVNHQSVALINGLTYDAPGFHKITATATNIAGSIPVYAHYSYVHATAPTYRRYFGDTHFHTGTATEHAWSIFGGDHAGEYTEAAQAYEYVSQVARLDFASLSEHDIGHTDDGWTDVQQVTQTYNARNGFTAFRAFEWTSGINISFGAHQIILYRDDVGEVLPFQDPTYSTYRNLVNALEAQESQQDAEFMVVPHPMTSNTFGPHPVFFPGLIDERHSRVFEFHSHFHNPPNKPRVFEVGEDEGTSGIDEQFTLQYAWGQEGNPSGKRKLHVGVIAASDNHFQKPGFNAYTAATDHAGSLAAVLTDASLCNPGEPHCRESIWDAYRARRTYGTSGPRIYIDFTADGHQVGEGYISSAARQFEIRVGAVQPLAEVTLVRFREADEYEDLLSITTFPDGDRYENLAFTDSDPMPASGEAFYYLRVIEEGALVPLTNGQCEDGVVENGMCRLNGRVAITTPIWVSSSDCDSNGVPDGLDRSNNCWPADMNADGSRDAADVSQFVDVMLGIDTCEVFTCPADMNIDGVASFLDVPCFVDVLLGTGPCMTALQALFQQDCNTNEIEDLIEIVEGNSEDCNGNYVPDECDVDEADPDGNGLVSADVNANGIPDECETDCNKNGTPDDFDIASQMSNDVNTNGIPDECEPDCNSNGVPDGWDLSHGTSSDCNANAIPDDCESDCNANGVPDDCDIDSTDPDGNGLVSTDCNMNGLPDECDLAFPPPFGSLDCNANGIPDECDIASGASFDANGNGIPDECESQQVQGGGGGEMALMGGEEITGGTPMLPDDAAWAAFYEWSTDQHWGPDAEIPTDQQFANMAAKLQELGLPLIDPKLAIVSP